VARAVGIDLGTSRCVVAIMEGGRPTVIANAEGSRATPSVVAFAADSEALAGAAADRVTGAGRTIRSVKRRLGTDWTASIDGTIFTAEQISGFILRKLKRDAEAYLGEQISDAVIAVPAYFSDAQRQATIQAGQLAGLNVLRIIPEPLGTALAYELARDDKEAAIVVFDLGGGSLSVSLLEVGAGVVEVKATSGDNDLGGDDWDQRIVDRLIEGFKNRHGIDLSQDEAALPRLRAAAEQAKIELSSSHQAQVSLPAIADGPLHLQALLTRAEFERMTADLLDRCKGPFQQVINDAGINAQDLNNVLLVGGSARMPAVVDLITSLANGKEPDMSSGHSTVAVGAALQAGVLRGEVKDVLPLDVTPLSLGIETTGGVFTVLIERNTTIPARRSEVFSTAEDNQAALRIVVFQGEQELAADNRKLGEFELSGIAPAARGAAQIEVTFDIDANGMVSVSAKDLSTGNQHDVRITGG
jgi:molecular chaperone DnaK